MNVKETSSLLFLLLAAILAIVTLALSGLGLLSPHTAWASATEWRGKGEVDVLLGVETDNEGWDVDDLLADAGKKSVIIANNVHGRSYRMWRWRMRTRAWWMDLARPSL